MNNKLEIHLTRSCAAALLLCVFSTLSFGGVSPGGQGGSASLPAEIRAGETRTLSLLAEKTYMLTVQDISDEELSPEVYYVTIRLRYPNSEKAEEFIVIHPKSAWSHQVSGVAELMIDIPGEKNHAHVVVRYSCL